jgi:hypothetical protein
MTRATVVACLVAIMGLAGCSGDDDDAATATSGPAAGMITWGQAFALGVLTVSVEQPTRTADGWTVPVRLVNDSDEGQTRPDFFLSCDGTTDVSGIDPDGLEIDVSAGGTSEGVLTVLTPAEACPNPTLIAKATGVFIGEPPVATAALP